MTSSLQTYLDSISLVFGTLLDLAGQTMAFVLENPILAIPVGTAILWTIVSIVKSFIYGQN